MDHHDSLCFCKYPWNHLTPNLGAPVVCQPGWLCPLCGGSVSLSFSVLVCLKLGSLLQTRGWRRTGRLRVTGRSCHGLRICHAGSHLSCATSGHLTTAGAATLENKGSAMASLNLLIKLDNPQLGLRGYRGGGCLTGPRRIWHSLSCSCSLLRDIEMCPVRRISNALVSLGPVGPIRAPVRARAENTEVFPRWTCD